MKNNSVIMLMLFFVSARVHAQENSGSYWSRGVNWLKDTFGFGQEQPLRMRELKSIQVPVLPIKRKDGKDALYHKGIQFGLDSSMHSELRGDGKMRYEFTENYSPHREVYVGNKYTSKGPINFMGARYGYDKSNPKYTVQLKQYEANAKTFEKVLPWLEKAYAEGQNSLNLADVNKQRYRYEGARSTLIAGGVVAGLAATIYGIYRAYNWYKGPLNRARNDIISAKSRVKNALNIITQQKIDTFYKEKPLTNTLQEMLTDFDAILQLIPTKK